MPFLYYVLSDIQELFGHYMFQLHIKTETLTLNLTSFSPFTYSNEGWHARVTSRLPRFLDDTSLPAAPFGDYTCLDED